MSLNVLTQGGGTGGESASIFITGLSETDVVTAEKDGKTINGRWNSAESRFEFMGIKSYGMWTVTATNGEKTKTQDVLVDAAIEYEVEMDFGMHTNFSTKETGWTEEGGTFTYGNGLYIPYGGTKGTISVSSDEYRKYLYIPCNLKSKWTISYSIYVYTSANAGVGGARVDLLDENNNVIVCARRGDAWVGNTNQNNQFFVNEESLYYEAAALNGITIDYKIDYTGKTIAYYENNVLKKNFDTTLKDIEYVRIGFYAASVEPIAEIKVGYLTLENG